MSSAVVFGGYGTFGSLVARDLARLGVTVVVAGRDAARAEAFARTLGPGHQGVAADVGGRASCQAAIVGHTVAVSCAGPFSTLGSALVEACLDAGCHYADLADDRDYVSRVRSYAAAFQQRGLTAVYGCSSVPGISGALALAARGERTPVPQRARVTLFVGNDNPKGGAAVSSVVHSLGKPLATPQGIVRAFRDREVVPLPEPFGHRAVYNFDSPEYDLFPELLGVAAVSVKLGFELRIATAGLALLASLSSRWGRRTVTLLEWIGSWTRGVGCSGGAVMTELFWADGAVRRVALLARRDGQRMAALPCSLAAHALCAGSGKPGVTTAYELLGGTLLKRLCAEGFELHQTS